MSGGYEYGGRETVTYEKLPGYKKLIVWQKAGDLGVLIHEATQEFGPGYYRLSDQMRAAIVSVTSNIAEGYCTGSLGSYIRHCLIARGSLGELGSQLQDSERWNLIEGEQLRQIVDLYAETSYLLDRLIAALRRKQKEGAWDRDFGVKDGQPAYIFDPTEVDRDATD